MVGVQAVHGIIQMKQPVPIFTANVVGGKLKFLPLEKDALNRWVMTFKTGAKVDIVIRKHRSKRTDLQNNYYWGVVIPILSDHFGYELEEMHEEMKLMFNPMQSKIDPSRHIGGSTTKMSTEEFYCGEQSYVERICRWAAIEHGVYIPPPKKVDTEEA